MEEINSDFFIYSIKSGSRDDFSNTEIIGDVVIDIEHSRSINLQNSNIKGKLILKTSGNINIESKRATFLSEVSLVIKRGRINMKGATFSSGLNINASEHFILDISETKLAGEINISDSKISNIDLSNLEFVRKEENDKFVFKYNEVQGTLNASNSKFHNAIFNSTKFASKVSFNDTWFSYTAVPSDGNFSDCIFENEVSFNNVNFDKDALFNRAQFLSIAHLTSLNKDTKCDGSFSGVVFSKRCFFNETSFNFVEFHNCEFGDVASFRGFKSAKLEISKSFFSKGSDFLYAKIYSADKETFRIIKNEFLKINNHTEALKYHSKEMKAYEKELINEGAWEDRTLLWLNRNSNEYGLNWKRGVVFTMIVAIVFYILYLLFLNERPFKWGWISWVSFFEATGETVKYFFKFFLPTHYFDFMNGFGPRAINYFIDFLGRIFIGYGIYQTIQAFRKYGKG